jgi:hypothetical protein
MVGEESRSRRMREVVGLLARVEGVKGGKFVVGEKRAEVVMLDVVAVVVPAVSCRIE